MIRTLIAAAAVAVIACTGTGAASAATTTAAPCAPSVVTYGPVASGGHEYAAATTSCGDLPMTVATERVVLRDVTAGLTATRTVTVRNATQVQSGLLTLPAVTGHRYTLATTYSITVAGSHQHGGRVTAAGLSWG